MCGAEIPFAKSSYKFEGISSIMNPKIILDPHFGVTLEEIESKIKGKVFISEKSTFLIKGSASLEDIYIDGVCKIEGNGHFKGIDIRDKKYN